MATRHISNKGINLVKSFEGEYLTAYKCPAGVWTIGYGHTGKVDGVAIGSGMKITSAKAVKLLQADMEEFEKQVESMVKVTINQHMFDALVSFSFNVGAGALKTSTLLKLLNEGKYKQAANHFADWNKATVNGVKKELAGLTRRRAAEKELFLTEIPVVKPSDTETLTPKSEEGKIAWLQKRLNKALGKNQQIDGIWDDVLSNQVLTYKKKNKLDESNTTNRSTKVGKTMITMLKK